MEEPLPLGHLPYVCTGVPGAAQKGRGGSKSRVDICQRGSVMEIMVFTDVRGAIWATDAQGSILAECFFKAVDETDEDIRQFGYRRLIDTYPAATIAAGADISVQEIEELFLEC
jgi:hypothetical protein